MLHCLCLFSIETIHFPEGSHSKIKILLNKPHEFVCFEFTDDYYIITNKDDKKLLYLVADEIASGSDKIVYDLVRCNSNLTDAWNNKQKEQKLVAITMDNDFDNERNMYNFLNGIPGINKIFFSKVHCDDYYIIIVDKMKPFVAEDENFIENSIVDLFFMLVFMHEHQIFHLDIKPDNILNNNGSYFFTDFENTYFNHSGLKKIKDSGYVSTIAMISVNILLKQLSDNIDINIEDAMAEDLYNTARSICLVQLGTNLIKESENIIIDASPLHNNSERYALGLCNGKYEYNYNLYKRIKHDFLMMEKIKSFNCNETEKYILTKSLLFPLALLICSANNLDNYYENIFYDSMDKIFLNEMCYKYMFNFFGLINHKSKKKINTCLRDFYREIKSYLQYGTI